MGARPPARRCCSWTSRPPASTPRSAPRCGARSPACTRRAGPDHPADHPLPRGGRPAGRRSWPSSTAAGWWRRGTPEELKGELRGRRGPSSSCGRAGRQAPRSGRAPACPACARCWSRAARCAPGSTTARPPSRRCWRRWRRAGVASPRSRSPRPSLDDVYLRHAGRAFSDADEEARAMTALRDAWLHACGRDLRVAAPPAVVDRDHPGAADHLAAAVRRAVQERSSRSPASQATSYIQFLTPGVVVMTALFSAGWGGMGMIEDIDRGVIDRFLVVARAAQLADRGPAAAGDARHRSSSR